MIKVVEVRHISSTRTNFVRHDTNDFDLCIGDIVVYDVPDGPGTDKTNGVKGPDYKPFHVGVVISIYDDERDDAKQDIWVIDRVDTDKYYARKEALADARHFKKMLDVKRRQFQDLEIYRLLAANDPEAKELLDQYTKALRDAGVRL